MEGDWEPKVVIVAEFPNTALANSWYESKEYAPALEVKQKAMDRNMILVEGVDRK